MRLQHPLKHLLVLVTLLASADLPGCSDKPASNLPTIALPVGKLTFTLEVATGGAARQTGLMSRDSMPRDHGMIFCFAEEQKLNFWMHNTRIPLDILYLDRMGRIVSIHPLEPYKEDGVRAAGPAKYAIELNRGMAAEAGVKPGDTLALPAAVTSATADP